MRVVSRGSLLAALLNQLEEVRQVHRFTRGRSISEIDIECMYPKINMHASSKRRALDAQTSANLGGDGCVYEKQIYLESDSYRYASIGDKVEWFVIDQEVDVCVESRFDWPGGKGCM